MIQTNQDFESSRREGLSGHRGFLVAALRQPLWLTANQSAISPESVSIRS
jgi:hypothetical protein